MFKSYNIKSLANNISRINYLYTFSNINNKLFKNNKIQNTLLFNFSDTTGKPSIELIKILRAETSKNIKNILN